MTELPDEPTPHDLEWADTVVAALAAAEDAQRSLYQACQPVAALREENALRRAEVLRAAAMGLSPAACAESAGISEKVLMGWRAKDPAFESAVRAAYALAEEHGVARAKVNPVGLGVVLRAIRHGLGTWEASALIGMQRAAFQRLRRENPQIDALVTAAQGFRTTATGKRKRPARGSGYRLVRRDDPS